MKRGFSLIEMILVVLIFTILFAAILTVLATQDRSWQTGYNKLTEQQEARRAVDRVARLLMQSKPEWVTIADDANFPGNQTIFFYESIFNEATQELEPRDWIGVRLNSNNSQELRMKKGNGGNWVAIAQQVEGVNFFGGDCAECSCFLAKTVCPTCDCSACKNITSNCPVVKIEIKTKKEKGFSLSTFATLRNNIVSDEIPEPPAEGEF